MDGDLVVEVRDTGMGIPDEKLPHLFGRSVILSEVHLDHSPSALKFGSTGLGLGLPIARGIVEAHGGTISVTSEVGRGSTFVVRVPLDLEQRLREVA